MLSTHENLVESFTAFTEVSEPLLRRALTAAFGQELGREATAEALAYGWQHWPRIAAMDNPVGYLYRVGQNHARRMSRRRPGWMAVEHPGIPDVEPGLAAALRSLSERQRVIVSLVHAFDLSLSEAAELLGISKSTAQTHERRAMDTLRSRLGVTS